MHAVAFALILAAAGSAPAHDIGRTDARRVLLLNSYHDGFAWSDGIVAGLREALDESGLEVDLHVEYMDTKRHPPEEVFPHLEKLLITKLAETAFDVVVTSDDNALGFLLERRDALCRGVPIVFCGLNGYRGTFLLGHADVTGVVEMADLAGTLDLAQRLHPERRKVHVIHDDVVSGRAAMRQLRAVSGRYAGRLDFHYVTDVTADELRRRLRRLGSDSFVFHLSFFRDRKGAFLTAQEQGRLVAESAPVPVYTCWDTFLGGGVFGGRTVSGRQQGLIAGDMAARILRGESAGDIPVVEDSPNVHVFDHQQLDRFDVDASDLPPDSVFVNAPPSGLRDTHGRLLLFAATSFLIMAGLVAGLALNIAVRRRAENALRESEENLRITLDSIGDAVIAADADGRVRRMNPVAEKLVGWTLAEALGRSLADVLELVRADDRAPDPDPARRFLAGAETELVPERFLLIARDGSEHEVAESGAPIRDPDRRVVGVVVVLRDVTRERELQEQLRQSQKMEAIGQLGGGVAHDFNNLLTGIIGCVDLLNSRLGGDEESLQYVDEILRASTRASELTRQLLAFSRRDRLQTVAVDLHEVIGEVVELLTRSIDRRIVLHERLEAVNHVVLGDPTQLQSAVLNLGLNARDAMPEGGEITFSTCDHLVDAAAVATQPSLRPGPHVLLSVTDTGVGMDLELQARIFEPFFTTKEQGEGTGLGLAAVYGCARSHRGAVRVSSAPGMGSTFRMLLPVSTSDVVTPEEQPSSAPQRGEGHVLVVDDERVVRDLVATALSQLGYRVDACADGVAAVELVREADKPFDLIILDMNMPRLGGADTFHLVREIRPNARVLVVSGFSRDAKIDDLLQAGAVGFLAKPFRIDELARVVARHVPVASS